MKTWSAVRGCVTPWYRTATDFMNSHQPSTVDRLLTELHDPRLLQLCKLKQQTGTQKFPTIFSGVRQRLNETGMAVVAIFEWRRKHNLERAEL